MVMTAQQAWDCWFFLQSSVLSEGNGDLDYLAVLEQFGDTTDPFAHVEALRSFGVQCDFITNGSFALVEQQIEKGIPVPVGWLHKGDLRHEGPSGGGHWSVITGVENSDLVICDPFGEADLLTGDYLEIGGNAGDQVLYNRDQFRSRWEIEGSGSGWMILASERSMQPTRASSGIDWQHS